MVREAASLLQEIGADFPAAADNEYFMGVSAKAKLLGGDFAEAASQFQKGIKIGSGKRNILLSKYSRWEALIRCGKAQEAETLLEQALAQAKSAGISGLVPAIYAQFVLLCLKRGDVAREREWENQRRDIKQQLDLPFEQDAFLLVAESEFDAAIRSVTPFLSSATEEKINKENEIEALIVLARAWHGKGDPAQGNDYLTRAAALMLSTSCRREQDRYDETRHLLDGAASGGVGLDGLM